jgi:hypothetical protein
MSSESPVFSSLREQLSSARTTSEVLARLHLIQESFARGELTGAEVLTLRASAFKTLQEATQDDPETAQRLILEELVRDLLSDLARDGSSTAQIALSRYYEYLGDWIDQYVPAQRDILRTRVLEALMPALETPRPEAACWSIARLGYRSPELAKALWKIVRGADDNSGDVALRALVALGVTKEERAEAVREVNRRAALRQSTALWGALNRLADPSSKDVLKEVWLRPEPPTPKETTWPLALTTFAEIADAHWENASLQQEIWNVFEDLRAQSSTSSSLRLYLGSNVVSRIDAPTVVPDLLTWLVDESLSSQEHQARRRYLLYKRLEECVRPRQLTGWQFNGPSREPAVALLKEDLARDSGAAGAFMTTEMEQKELACDQLLRLGEPRAIDWIERAIDQETSPFVRQSLLETLACFRVDPLPEIVSRLIVERYDHTESGSVGVWAYRRAAIMVAANSPTKSAFDALMDFGLTYKGQTLTTSGQALADVATALLVAGERSIPNRLADVADQSTTLHRRSAAIYTLATLALHNRLPNNYGRLLERLTFDNELDLYTRGLAITGLGAMKRRRLSDGLRSSLVDWAENREDWLGWRSLEALARRGAILEHPSILLRRVGLHVSNDRWEFRPESNLSRWAAYVIGLLYGRHPTEFAEATVGLLTDGSWDQVFQAVDFLERTHHSARSKRVPPQVMEALLARIKREQRRSSAELHIFSVAARLMPNRLVREDWPTMWSDWMPESRSALAEALGSSDGLDLEGDERAVGFLLSLVGDGQYGVRRAAYRGLARRNPRSLYAFCKSTTRSSEAELRRRAAEATAFLENDAQFADIQDALQTDAEKGVREAAQRARLDRHRSSWSKDYLERLRRMQTDDNAELLAAWAYGQALTSIGDDDVMASLREMVRQNGRSPNVRYWFGSLIKEIERNWRKATKSWPDPWFSWTGTVESGRGTLVLPGGQRLKIQYSIWKEAPSTPADLGGWGGAVWSDELPDLGLLAADAPGDLHLLIENGREGRILFSESSSGIVTFLGQGEFPN